MGVVQDPTFYVCTLDRYTYCLHTSTVCYVLVFLITNGDMQVSIKHSQKLDLSLIISIFTDMICGKSLRDRKLQTCQGKVGIGLKQHILIQYLHL